MRLGDIDLLIDAMAEGARAIAVFANMQDAASALHAVRSRLAERGIEHSAWRSNARMRIESGGGCIRFGSERGELRGFTCDVLYLDGRARFRDWMEPLHAMASMTIDERAGLIS